MHTILSNKIFERSSTNSETDAQQLCDVYMFLKATENRCSVFVVNIIKTMYYGR